jgi:hypothetical protein
LKRYRLARPIPSAAEGESVISFGGDLVAGAPVVGESSNVGMKTLCRGRSIPRTTSRFLERGSSRPPRRHGRLIARAIEDQRQRPGVRRANRLGSLRARKVLHRLLHEWERTVEQHDPVDPVRVAEGEVLDDWVAEASGSITRQKIRLVSGQPWTQTSGTPPKCSRRYTCRNPRGLARRASNRLASMSLLAAAP